MSHLIYGRWTIIGEAPCGNWNQQRVLCRCECGTQREVILQTLTNGRSKSCGCYKNEQTVQRLTTHGKSNTRTFRIWDNILGRCTRPRNDRYKDYGGRGITVCQQWQDSFAQFLADMGDCPSPKHEIDRIDNNAGYSPENCHWVTRRENVMNRRNTLWVLPLGVRMTMDDCAKLFNVSRITLRLRLRAGWNLAKALMLPKQKGGRGKSYC